MCSVVLLCFYCVSVSWLCFYAALLLKEFPLVGTIKI